MSAGPLDDSCEWFQEGYREAEAVLIQGGYAAAFRDQESDRKAGRDAQPYPEPSDERLKILFRPKCRGDAFFGSSEREAVRAWCRYMVGYKRIFARLFGYRIFPKLRAIIWPHATEVPADNAVAA